MIKQGNYAILPAAIRYDKRLSSIQKLLYAEITACVNTASECEEDNTVLAEAMGCDVRSIYRHLKALEVAGYIKRTRDEKKTTIKLVESLSSKAPEEEQTSGYSDEVSYFFDRLLGILERGLGIKIERRDLYFDVIADRLQQFSPEHLIIAAENRIKFVANSSWHQAPENIGAKSDIMLLLKDNASVLKYLNMKFEEKEKEVFKPHKFN